MLVSRLFLFCDSGGIQTHNPHIRSVVLYSVELRNQRWIASAKVSLFFIPAKLFLTFF